MRNMDPRWITARFGSLCAGCKATITKGQRVFYYPAGKSVYGEACGCAETRAAEFAGAVADEETYNSGYGGY